jgi:lipoprotein-releasing system permease protein
VVSPGFQSFVAWRYLMERRRPPSPLLVAVMLTLAATSAVGVGIAIALVALHGPLALAGGLGDAMVVLLAIAAMGRARRIHAPRLLVPLGLGLLAGFLVPAEARADAVLWNGLVGGGLVLVLLTILASLGSRAIAAIMLGCVLASMTAFGFAVYIIHDFQQANPGVKPFNQLVAALSPLHEKNGLGIWALRIMGSALVAGGAGLAMVRRRWVRTVGWGWIVGGVLCIGYGIGMEWLVGERTSVEWLAWGGGVALAPLPLLLTLGTFRHFFTFFTTVSMAGVFVGSMALVVVLSIMGGFENDLRDKILGSNAHIRVTREEGMIQDWREVMARVHEVPGVVATTPYATTEVVLSANSNYATVVIKGIDPDTVGEVTELVADIEGTPEEDADAMRRLYPLREDTSGDEPGPDAGPDGDEPIDYSAGDEAEDDAEPEPEDAEPEPGAVDPVPDDFEAPEEDEEPEDFSHAQGGVIELKDLIDGTAPGREPAILDLPPAEGGRIALLDGVLVGKELAKTLHLFVGQEVRLVSPLADPANPDATGTPIPFHRDYRIAGIFYTGMYEYDLKFVYVPLESLQEFLQLGDEIDGIEVRIVDPESTGRIRDQIARALGPGYLVQDWKELNRNLFSALKLEKIAMFLVLAIIILVASFSIVGNLIMIVVEKSKEIALIKTLGASDVGVMRIFVMQGFFIGVVGTLAGVALGLLICWGAQELGFPINPDVYYIKELPIHIEPWSVAAIATAGLVISAVATIYPAVVAARLRPAIGLRHD